MDERPTAWPPDPLAAPSGPPLTAARRAALFALALLAGLWFADRTAALALGGLAASAALLGVAGFAYVAFLAALALAPAASQRALSRFSAVRLSAPGHLVALVAVASAAFFVFALGSGIPFALTAERAILGKPDPASAVEVAESAVLLSLAFNVLVLVVPVLLWLRFVHGLAGRALAESLGFRSGGTVRAAAIGVGVAFLAILALAAVALAADAAGLGLPPNERALEIGLALSVPGALAVAALASVTEEIFFRGYLQPRIGLVAQAVLFGVAHLSYFHALQIVATLGLGFAFGVAYRATGRLAAPLAAHFAFNAVMLLAAQTVPPLS